jgi:hypothetical protein
MRKRSAASDRRQEAQKRRATFVKTRVGKKHRPPVADPLIRLLSIGRTRISFGEQLAFEPDFIESSLNTIKELRSIVEAGRKVYLDFSLTTRVQAAAITYLSSEVDLLRGQYGPTFASYSHVNTHERVHKILAEMGLLNRIGNSNNIPVRRSYEDLIPVIMGVDKENLDVILNFILEKALRRGNLELADRAKAENLAFKALSEAMLNVKQHAYPNDSLKPWWITASILKNVIYIAFCDRGVGMPATIPKSLGDAILSLGSLMNKDGDLIRAAMRHTRSSVAERGGRGYGTKDIQAFVKDPEFRGQLSVVSGGGYYSLNIEENCSAPSEVVHNFSACVEGTTLLWIIPVQG